MLCFDCLVADNQNVMSKSLDKRYGVRLLSDRVSVNDVTNRGTRSAFETVVLQTVRKNDAAIPPHGFKSTLRVCYRVSGCDSPRLT